MKVKQKEEAVYKISIKDYRGSQLVPKEDRTQYTLYDTLALIDTIRDNIPDQTPREDYIASINIKRY